MKQIKELISQLDRLNQNLERLSGVHVKESLANDVQNTEPRNTSEILKDMLAGLKRPGAQNGKV